MAGGVHVLAIFAGLQFLAPAQETTKPDDVLQMKNGAIFVGKVLTVTQKTVEIRVNGERNARTISTSDVMPYSVYRLRLERIDKTSGRARLKLAEFCLENELHSTAHREFENAIDLDKSLKLEAREGRDQAYQNASRAKFEEGERYEKQGRLGDAYLLFKYIVDHYPESPRAGEALTRAQRIAREHPEELTKEKRLRRRKGGPVSPSYFIPLLSREDPVVRAYAADRLGHLGSDAKEAVPALIKAVKDQDKYVRMQAIWALGRMGSAAKYAVPAIKGSLRDEDEAVRGEAEKALGRIEREY